MIFNVGGYKATSKNQEKTEWAVVSHNEKEAFDAHGKIGVVTNNLLKMTTARCLGDSCMFDKAKAAICAV